MVKNDIQAEKKIAVHIDHSMFQIGVQITNIGNFQ